MFINTVLMMQHIPATGAEWFNSITILMCQVFALWRLWGHHMDAVLESGMLGVEMAIMFPDSSRTVWKTWREHNAI